MLYLLVLFYAKIEISKAILANQKFNLIDKRMNLPTLNNNKTQGFFTFGSVRD